MKKLIMCQGLPGSGKSWWAVEQVVNASPADSVVRVNQDDIRKELGWIDWASWDFKGNAEKRVYTIKALRIEQALAAGQTVISDDTNLARARKTEFAQLAQKHGAVFEIKRFDTPIDVCVARDAQRTHPVGEKVIRDMASKYHVGEQPLYEQFAPYIRPDGMPAIICDLDGTLAIMGNRSPYDASTCDQDAINPPVLDVIRRFSNVFYQIIYLSGREDKFRAPTERFFNRHNCPPGPLHMRKTGDHRKDWIVKGELFDAHVRHKYDVRFVFDDRNQVVNMWRAIGLTCFQVAPGDF